MVGKGVLRGPFFGCASLSRRVGVCVCVFVCLAAGRGA